MSLAVVLTAGQPENNSAVVVEAMVAEAMVAEATGSREKCTLLCALPVEKIPRCRSNREMGDQCTAATATQRKDVRNSRY